MYHTVQVCAADVDIIVLKTLQKAFSFSFASATKQLVIAGLELFMFVFSSSETRPQYDRY